jgi:flagellar assembly protein FliH
MAFHLEPFDAAPAPEPAPPGPSADWLLGHAAGLAEGIAAERAREAALAAELAQTLGDAAFTYAEARAQVLAALGPLFRLLMERLLPDLLAETLGARLAAMLAAAAREDSGRPLCLSVHPAHAAALAARLPAERVRITADPGLAPLAARLSGPAGETSLDLDACLAEARAALAALLDAADRKESHA